MGWLYMKTFDGPSGPQGYLDRQFTCEQPEFQSRVLRSALVGNDVYYAAVEHRPTGDDTVEIWALICLVDYNPKHPNGFIFGYKDMCETMGPYAAECPAEILDLLTPTENAYANAWRNRCREAIVRNMLRSS